MIHHRNINQSGWYSTKNPWYQCNHSKPFLMVKNIKHHGLHLIKQLHLRCVLPPRYHGFLCGDHNFWDRESLGMVQSLGTQCLSIKLNDSHDKSHGHIDIYWPLFSLNKHSSPPGSHLDVIHDREVTRWALKPQNSTCRAICGSSAQGMEIAIKQPSETTNSYYSICFTSISETGCIVVYPSLGWLVHSSPVQWICHLRHSTL